MRNRLVGVMGVAVIVITVAGLLRMTRVSVEGQNPAGPAPPGQTPWGEPNLQGIWTDPYQTPLQRPAQFVGKEFFTEEERAELDRQRAELLRRDSRAEPGSERDVSSL